MKSFKKLFEITISIQLVLFLLFILENINRLDEIVFTFDIGGLTEFELNFYSLLAGMALIFVVAILLSFSIFGGGLNDEGSKSARRYIGFAFCAVLLFVGTNYYIGSFGWIGTVINLFMGIIYALYAIQMLINQED